MWDKLQITGHTVSLFPGDAVYIGLKSYLYANMQVIGAYTDWFQFTHFWSKVYMRHNDIIRHNPEQDLPLPLWYEQNDIYIPEW